jgi:hypothetical protein
MILRSASLSRRLRLFGALAVLAVSSLAAACGGTPADVAGTYSINVTDEDNGCGFQNWTVGQVSMNIPMTVTQQQGQAQAQATITGLVGTYLTAVFGTNVFDGDVSGNDVTLVMHSTKSFTSNNCSYFVTATAHATLVNDSLSGTIVYTTQTNNSPDCATINNCHSQQAFDGSRPKM